MHFFSLHFLYGLRTKLKLTMCNSLYHFYFFKLQLFSHNNLIMGFLILDSFPFFGPTYSLFWHCQTRLLGEGFQYLIVL